MKTYDNIAEFYDAFTEAFNYGDYLGKCPVSYTHLVFHCKKTVVYVHSESSVFVDILGIDGVRRIIGVQIPEDFSVCGGKLAVESLFYKTVFPR